MSDNKNISHRLCKWFEINKRQLPWRETTDAYHIWVSEIILQQTRVAQGYDYYTRFVERFPDVFSLASADEEEVLKYWEGLGYYSRARNMHTAARQIVEKHSGVFPNNYCDIRNLKGVGDYTAAAIASFAYGLSHAVVDGNVYRVLSRLFDIETPIDTAAGKKLFDALAHDMLDRQNSARHNQAMMELGALICTPRNTLCDKCPLSDICLSVSKGTIESRPLKKNKTSVKPRYFNYLIVHCGNNTFINKRTQDDIWRNLYEYILIESDKELTFESLQQHEEYKRVLSDCGNITILCPTYSVRHALSHRTIYATFHTLQVERENKPLASYRRISIKELDDIPFARLTGIYHEYIATHEL